MTDSNSNVTIRAVERDEPDLRRLARALIDLAIEQGSDVAPSEHADSDDRKAA